MRRIKGAKVSPALLVAVVALVAALAGTAIGGVAVTSLNKKDKKQVTKIAKKQAKKLDKKIELTPGPKGDQGETGEAGPVGPTEGTAADLYSRQGTTLTKAFSTDASEFTTTRAGKLLVIKSVSRISVECSAGGVRFWLEVDDVRVPGTAIRQVPSDEDQHGVTLSGVTTDSVAAGDHIAEIAWDCPDGDWLRSSASTLGGVSAVVLGG